MAAADTPGQTIESDAFPGLSGLDAECLARAETEITTAMAGSVRLDLRWLQLISLPECIKDVAATKHLYCHNLLTSLPESLGTCRVLEGLWCCGNQLTSLPESLGACVTLQYIYCAENPWDPTWIEEQQGLSSGNCPSVKSLQVFAKKQQAGRVKPAR